MSKINKLPAGWMTVRVDEAGSVRLGRQRSPDKHTGRFPTKYLRAANITAEGINLTDVLEMDFTPAEREIYELVPGDVLLTEASGSAAQVGRAAIWRGALKNCCFQNTVVRFRPHLVLPEFSLLVFRHYLVSGTFSGTARGVGIQHLGASRFGELDFPLPPLTEQRRITSLAEVRLTEIREAEARLKSALSLLREQVIEILAAAASGELVAQRLSNVPPYTLKPSVRAQRSTVQPTLFSEPLIPLETDTPIPSGWKWVRIEDAGTCMLGRQRSPKYQSGEYMRPYLRVANVLEDRIDATDVLSMNFEPEAYKTYALNEGDILLNEGQSPELVGRPAMYRGEVPGACFQNHLIRFRAEPEVIPEFALLVFRHYLHDGIFKAIARWSTNIATLGVERFRKLPFPLPPPDEQKRIVVEARRRLEANAAQVTVVETSLSRFPEMERELFAAAVAGELAAQVSSDEPAEEMIKRLGPVPKASLKFKANKSEGVEKLMASQNRKSSGKSGILADLASTIHAAGRPLSLPELFVRAGYDRDEPEHVERFYLSLRVQIGKTIRQIGDATENAQLDVIDAP